MAKIIYEIRFGYVGRIAIYIELNAASLYIGLFLPPQPNQTITSA